MKNLKRWVVYLLLIINMLILMTITNNSILIDLILGLICGINWMIIFRYDHKYINTGDLNE